MPIIFDESGRNCFEIPVSNEIKSDAYLNLTFALKIPLFTVLLLFFTQDNSSLKYVF